MRDTPSFVHPRLDGHVAPTTGPKPAAMTVGEHAVVLGASLAGLAAAASLAERFDRVTIVERDTMPQSGDAAGIPGTARPHLVARGLVGLSELLPGIVEDLRARRPRDALRRGSLPHRQWALAAR